MCKTQKNTPTYTVCNKTNNENNLPDQSFHNLSSRTCPKQDFQSFLCRHLCKDYRLGGGIRADVPVVISLKSDQSACMYCCTLLR